MRQTHTLREPVQAYSVVLSLWGWIKSMLLAGHEIVIEARPATRSDKQNRMLHAMLGQISKQIEWAGKKRAPEVWKRLLVAGWCRARGESIEILPAIDGYGIDVVFRRTSELTKGECVELCDFIGAWCAENGVDIRGPEWIDPETGEICTRPGDVSSSGEKVNTNG